LANKLVICGQRARLPRLSRAAEEIDDKCSNERKRLKALLYCLEYLLYAQGYPPHLWTSERSATRYIDRSLVHNEDTMVSNATPLCSRWGNVLSRQHPYFPRSARQVPSVLSSQKRSATLPVCSPQVMRRSAADLAGGVIRLRNPSRMRSWSKRSSRISEDRRAI
jgi:hypothetical protein